MTQNEKKPLELLRIPVREEWLDYNEHMNAGCYAVAYNFAMERFWTRMELGENQVKAGWGAPFVLECHLTYQRELKRGDPLLITLQLLDHDEKKAHVFLRMFHAEKGYLASTYEQVSVYVDLRTRRSVKKPAAAREKLEDLYRAHRELPKPPEAGSVISLRRKQ
jgi:acyl-CoA thioester hydrolase